MVIKILDWRGQDELRQNINKEMENIKKKRTRVEVYNNLMKNTLEGFNSRLENVKEWISDLKDRLKASNQTKQKREKIILRSKERLGDL